MQKVLDGVVNAVKWPAALAAVLFLPGSVTTMGPLLDRLTEMPGRAVPFVMGFLGYAAGWWLAFRKRAWGSAFSTLEHELTHALFAVLTFHRVTSIKTTWQQGGAVRIEGGGNWLIAVAPYFFQTLTFVVLVFMFFMEGGGPGWLNIALGATVCYHATSTWRETHREQTDLKEVGFLFAFFFLPAVNVLSYGFILAFVLGGWPEGQGYLGETWRSTLELSTQLLARVRA